MVSTRRLNFPKALTFPSTHPQFGIPLPHRPQMPRPARCCLWMLRVLSWLARRHSGPHLRVGLFCRHPSFHQVLSSQLPVLQIEKDRDQSTTVARQTIVGLFNPTVQHQNMQTLFRFVVAFRTFQPDRPDGSLVLP